MPSVGVSAATSQGRVTVRLQADDSLYEALARIAAAIITGNRVRISIPVGLYNAVTGFLEGTEGRRFTSRLPIVFEDDGQLIKHLPEAGRLRYAAADRVPAGIYQAAATTGPYISRQPVLMEGRIELLRYLRQQSISYTYHRYGNLGLRAARHEQ